MAAHLAPVAVAIGRSWVKYSEGPATKAQVDKPLIQRQHAVLQSLRELHQGLAFNKSTVKERAKLLLSKFSGNPDWDVKEDDLANYLGAISKRAVNMCRVVSQDSVS